MRQTMCIGRGEHPSLSKSAASKTLWRLHQVRMLATAMRALTDKVAFLRSSTFGMDDDSAALLDGYPNGDAGTPPA